MSAFRSAWLALLLPLALAACGGQPRMLVVSAAKPDELSARIRIFAATSRAEAEKPEYFNGERSAEIGFARLEIGVPRNHKPGQLELPGNPRSAGEPVNHFTVGAVDRLSEAQILREVRAELARRPAGQRDVLVFVHGFNTNFADAAFRFAQIVADSGFKGVPVLFAWPSRGQVLAYPYDRDSADFSRDSLEAGLRVIARDLGATRFDILAHSMGTLLTMEALRQAAIRGDGGFGGKLRDVMLAAPDIDLDLFRTQMAVIRRPVTVFASADDRALDFSRRFAGDKTRLGAISEKDTQIVAELARTGARIVDLSDVRSGDEYNHGKFASSRIVQLIGRRLGLDGVGPDSALGDVLRLDASAQPGFVER